MARKSSVSSTSSRSTCSSSHQCIVDWEVLIPSGPQLAFHTGCVIDTSLYVHGGISVKGNNSPSNKLYKLDLESGIWNEIKCDGSPALSHHTCVVWDQRYILYIGGWTGKCRSSKVYVYNVRDNSWRIQTTVGFPEDGGLSSHTTTLLADGTILVIGRDGSLRMQRRHGNAYLLSGSPEKGFKYSEFSNAITSRSGHTTSVVGNKIFIIGGRSDKFVEVYSGYSSMHTHSCQLISTLVASADKLKPLAKFPCGRRHHVSLPVSGGLFVHGGETFDGKCRESVGDMFLMTTKPVGNFYKLGTSSVGRLGHVCVCYNDRVIFHGGVAGKDGQIRCETYELRLKC